MTLLAALVAQADIGTVLAVKILRHHEGMAASGSTEVVHLPHRPVRRNHIIREVWHRDVGVRRKAQGSGVGVVVREADRPPVVRANGSVPTVRDPVALEAALGLYIVDIAAGPQSVVRGSLDGCEVVLGGHCRSEFEKSPLY